MKTVNGASTRPERILGEIESFIRILVIGDREREEARLTFSALSRALAVANGKKLDAYSLAGIAERERWHTRLLKLGAKCVLIPCGIGTAGWAFFGGIPGLLGGLAITSIFVAQGLYFLGFRNAEREHLKENRDQLSEFEQVVLWLGAKLTAGVKDGERVLPALFSRAELKSKVDQALERRAFSVLQRKAAPGPNPEENTERVAEAERLFFPFHRILARAGIADEKVDGYFDRARKDVVDFTKTA
jgi:hypothetical protein